MAYQFFDEWVLNTEHIQLSFHQSFWQSYPPAEFFKIFPSYSFDIRHLHSLLEQSIVKSKKSRRTQVQRSIDKVIGW